MLIFVALPPDKWGMRALSIRQPFAELILRGIKKVEYRSRPTKIIGERFLIYASKGLGQAWSTDLAMPDEPLPGWMIELAEQIKLIEPTTPLPTGVIVGSAVIEKVTENDQFFEWHLTHVERAADLRKPTRQPQPVWFTPFQEANQ